MVKKTLLSIAIAASVASLAGCNVSTTDKHDNKVAQTPVTAGKPGSVPATVAPVFSAANGQVPLAIDLLFAKAATTDGTADTADTTPPVTTALNKLDGFSTVAPIYIEFNSALDADSVVAGKTVFLAKLNPLDGEALKVDEANPFNGTSPITPAAYEARAIDMNGKPAIQILLKKPLAPKTKYLVIVTSGVKSQGQAAGMSAEYSLVAGDLQLPSAALEPVRGAVQGWQKLANGFLASGSPLVANKEGSSILSYTFTTGGTTDVLNAMAAPGTFLTSQIPTHVHAEGAIKGSVEKAVRANPALAGADETTIQGTIDSQLAAKLAQVAQGVGIKLNAAGAPGSPFDYSNGSAFREVLIASDALRPYYYAGLITAIADGQGAGVDTAVDKPKSRTYQAIVSAPSTPVAVTYDAFLTAQVTPKVHAAIEKQVRANPALANADEATIQAQIDAAIAANASTQISAQVTALSSKGTIYQGGLKVPNYLPEAEAGVADAALATWVASDAAATALGLPATPKDVNGSTNVTYRFPFANKLGDSVIPVMATLPATSACGPKPTAGWPVVIYQHGFTVDRTAGVLVGNALAKACVAMVAIDHAMHGVGPTSATGLLFNVNTASATAAKSPFALYRAGAAQAGNTFMADLHERHNNVGKTATQQNVAMVFKDAAGAAADAVNVGASGDLYINLQNFARTRDGMRQTVLDMLNLNASIDAMNVDANGAADDLDPSKVYFIGHSLGGIIGTTFVAVNNDPQVQTYNKNLPKIQAAILGNAGAGVVKLLENSPSIGGAKILPGLQAANPTLVQGSANLEKFFGVMQAMVDSADPINFASGSGLANTPVLVYEAVGGVGGAKTDLVVPNNALGATVATAKSYLAGTDALIQELGITKAVNSKTATEGTNLGSSGYYYPSVTNTEKVRVAIRMGAGDHGTFSSAASAEDTDDNKLGQKAFTEMYGQIATFISAAPYAANGGALGNAGGAPLKGFLVKDTSVLEQAE
jgi:pimeloyl-ACP methyl ester carboxylesterase